MSSGKSPSIKIQWWFAAAGLLAFGALNTVSAISDTRVLAPTTNFSKPERYELLPGGGATSRKLINANAFSHSSANMTFLRELDFKIGNGFFRRLWVSAPASTQASDGLGPLYNARSCQRCHLKDGRGHPPANSSDNAVSMILRLSIPPQNKIDRQARLSGQAKFIPAPIYGTQLQDFAIQGQKAEGRVVISYKEVPIQLSDGETASLRVPNYSLIDLGFGPMHEDIMISPRVAPPMIGLGLLEAVPEKQILSYADPKDMDSDGISGRPNNVWSNLRGRLELGRFGWKAGNATLTDQTADALSGDIGLSNPLFPNGSGDCTARQLTCRNAPNGNSPQYQNLEVPQRVLDLVVFYVRNLAVPKRRDISKPAVLAGKRVFYETGCTACHRPKFITQGNPPGMPEQSRQLIWPYTDLLLHDMGDGLADHWPEGRANGREWRTAPLWGIGLTEMVNGHTQFLHDGRARNILEAILWHGGEAEEARRKVVEMPSEDRRNLLRFIGSL